ncbi:hypothetical protein V6K52_15410 [Knoellia sp. S7-12]|uniref:hypothetical protein n=1 Tax=Knoellia sp. S7-12 TaxID=3126698 RepID=UPI003367EE5D
MTQPRAGEPQGRSTFTWIGWGALVGAVLTLLWSFSSPGEGGSVPDTQILVYMGVVLVPLGATLGALVVALLPDGRGLAPLPPPPADPRCLTLRPPGALSALLVHHRAARPALTTQGGRTAYGVVHGLSQG